MDNTKAKNVIILGAGLAGLTAGYQLSKAGLNTLIIERDSKVGGLAKTLEHNGFRFDVGGHRFKTDNKPIEQLVRNLLDNELLEVKRSSKILLRQKYFYYPLQPLNAVFGLGIATASRIILDYALEQIKPSKTDEQLISLEDWVVRHFGRTLFNIYFKEYSEKIWGIDCQQICKEWVEQRIQGLSLGKAIKNALFKSSKKTPHTLTSKFLYPPYGIGQISEKLKDEIDKNNRIMTSSNVVRINHNGNKVESVAIKKGGQTYQYGADEFISSIPLARIVHLLHPKPPADILDAASRLRYRDLVIVTVMIDRDRVTDQSWIYIPEQKIPFGRIHEPTNWSASMAPEGKTLLVTEHFCFRGDDTWKASDNELVDRTVENLETLGFIKRDEVTDSVVLRVPHAYPLFELGYATSYKKICDYVETFSNLHLTGRGGLFRYYNMDHTMQSGINVANKVLNMSSAIQTDQHEHPQTTSIQS